MTQLSARSEPVHEQVATFAGPTSMARWAGSPGLTFLCVSGLAGSLADWAGVAPGLSRHGEVLAVNVPSRDGRSTVATAADYAHHRVRFLAEALRRRSEAKRRFGPREHAAGLRALARFGLRPELFHACADRVLCPVLLIHGQDDHYVPPAFARGAAVTLTGGWKCSRAQGTSTQRDQPAAWVASVEHWLAPSAAG